MLRNEVEETQRPFPMREKVARRRWVSVLLPIARENCLSPQDAFRARAGERCAFFAARGAARRAGA